MASTERVCTGGDPIAVPGYARGCGVVVVVVVVAVCGEDAYDCRNCCGVGSGRAAVGGDAAPLSTSARVSRTEEQRLRGRCGRGGGQQTGAEGASAVVACGAPAAGACAAVDGTAIAGDGVGAIAVAVEGGAAVVAAVDVARVAAAQTEVVASAGDACKPENIDKAGGFLVGSRWWPVCGRAAAESCAESSLSGGSRFASVEEEVVEHDGDDREDDR
jgi:hypothetical protein